MLLPLDVELQPRAIPIGLGQRIRRAIPLLLRTMLKFVAVVVLLTLARSTLADQYHVPTSSMWPTIAPGDRIFVDKAAYGLRVPFTTHFLFAWGGPQAGDVVVFADPRGGPIPLVKRVVALAGQTVSVQGGVLYVDGKPQRLEELRDGRVVEHLGGIVHGAGHQDFEAFGPVVVPADHIFMMGDNRAASLDSRELGAVPASLVRGQVRGVVYHHDASGFDASRFMASLD